jgi:hypothetical protein
VSTQHQPGTACSQRPHVTLRRPWLTHALPPCALAAAAPQAHKVVGNNWSGAQHPWPTRHRCSMQLAACSLVCALTRIVRVFGWFLLAAVIARMLPGRTNAAIKNLWYRRQAAKGHRCGRGYGSHPHATTAPSLGHCYRCPTHSVVCGCCACVAYGRQRGAAAATGAAPLPAAAAEARRQLLPGGVAGNGGEEASDSEEMLGEEEGLDASDDMDVNDAGAADGAAEAGEEDEDEEDEEADAGEEVADYFGHAQAAAAAAAAAGGRGWGAAAGMPQWQVQQQQQFAGAATCSTGTAAGGWGFGAAPAAVDRMQHQRLSSRAPRRSSNHSWSGAAPFTAPALDGSCYAHPMLAPARGTVLPMPGGPAANQPASLAQTTTVHRGE